MPSIWIWSSCPAAAQSPIAQSNQQRRLCSFTMFETVTSPAEMALTGSCFAATHMAARQPQHEAGDFYYSLPALAKTKQLLYKPGHCLSVVQLAPMLMHNYTTHSSSRIVQDRQSTQSSGFKPEEGLLYIAECDQIHKFPVRILQQTFGHACQVRKGREGFEQQPSGPTPQLPRSHRAVRHLARTHTICHMSIV